MGHSAVGVFDWRRRLSRIFATLLLSVALLLSPSLSAFAADESIKLVSWSAVVGADRGVSFIVVTSGGGGLQDFYTGQRSIVGFICAVASTGDVESGTAMSFGDGSGHETAPDTYSLGPNYPGSTDPDAQELHCHMDSARLYGKDGSQLVFATADEVEAAGFWLEFVIPGAASPTTLPVATAPPSRGAGTAYVALGDSYSAGEGLGPFLAGTDVTCDRQRRLGCRVLGISNGNQCHRSVRAFPQLVLAATKQSSMTFRACSGAVIDDFSHARGITQKPSSDDELLYDPEEPAQAVWLGSDTRYVTLTVGGNDAGFTEILKGCTFNRNLRIRNGFAPPDSFTKQCNALIDSGFSSIEGINPSLKELYRLILQRAPQAEVRVVNYPVLFPDPKEYTGYQNRACEVSQIGAYIMDAEVSRMRELNIALNDTIQSAVSAVRSEAPNNARLKLVDAQARFGKHTVSCGDKNRPEPWINAGLARTLLFDPISTASFHPTKVGQCQIAVIVQESFGLTRQTRC